VAADSRPPLPEDDTATTPPAPAAGRRARLLVLGLAILLLACGNILVNMVLPGWAYPLVNALVAGALIGLALALRLGSESIGFSRRHLRRSVLVGAVGGGLVVLAFVVMALVPELRGVFDDGRAVTTGLGGLLWAALIRIPVGTVLLEEVAFRGVLPAILGGGARWRWTPVLVSSVLFGLWHLLPSLALTGNAALRGALGGASQVLISGLAVLVSVGLGVLLYAWRQAGRGLLAPMMVHVATNSGAIVFAWMLYTHA
jgi:membrane protease YdiL (CAAX protease family)